MTGIENAARPSALSRTSVRAISARAIANPTSGMATNIAYVGCTNARSIPAAASVSASCHDGARTNSKKSAMTAGTSSCRDIVPGSSSDV